MLDGENCAIGKEADLKTAPVAQRPEPEVVHARSAEYSCLGFGHGLTALVIDQILTRSGCRS